MGLDAPHAEYAAYEPIWRRIDDAIAGEDAIMTHCMRAAQAAMGAGRSAASLRAQVGSYLPMMPGQIADTEYGLADYAVMLAGAEYYNATGRTVDGLVGTVFARDPEVALTAPLRTLVDDVDRCGTPMQVVAKDILRRVVSHARSGVLLDMPAAAATDVSPYLVAYSAYDIINWRVDVLRGVPTLTLVVLCEAVATADPDDEFSTAPMLRYRVLDLADGVYRVRLYQPRDGGGWQMVAPDATGEMVPTDTPIVPRPQRGAPIDYIPFVFIGASTLASTIETPPILDLVNVNLHHFRLSAKLNHALTVSSLPQLVIVGDTTRDPNLVETRRMGAPTAWELPSGASATYVEATGTGIAPIREEMAADESRMVLLGARLLEPQKRAAETTETLRLRQAGEMATLATIADTVSWGLSRALGWAAEWVGASPAENYITLNQDFADTTMSEADANLLAARRDKGLATLRDCFELLQKGGRIQSEITFEQWRLELENEAIPAQPTRLIDADAA